MSLRKHGLKALGLTFFAALALMAITAPGASATAGKLLILDASKTTLTELAAELTGEIDLLGVLHVPAINLEIHCTTFAVNEGKYLVGGHGHGKILYSGCLTYQLSPLTHLAGCEVYPTAADRTAGTNKGHITANALLLVLKHTGASGSKVVIKAEPKVAGGSFAHLFFKNCPTGATALIGGALTLLLHSTGHQVKHLFQEAAGSFKLDQLLYGVNPANILGSVWVQLTGAHAGREWGLC